jgi:AcrR family transcriptional regulator
MPKWTEKEIQELFTTITGPEDPDDSRLRKRKKIVAAGTELFIRQGYRKTNVDEIAQRAGVAKGTVYLYFKTKSEILLHAIVEEKRRYFEVIRPILGPDVPPDQRLREYLKLVFVMATRMPLISKLMSGDREIYSVFDELLGHVPFDWQGLGVDFIGDMVDRAAAPHHLDRTRIEDRARVIMGLVHFSALISEDRIRSGLSVDRFSEILTDMLMDGLGGSRAPEERDPKGDTKQGGES